MTDTGKIIATWWHETLGDREAGQVSGRARAVSARLRRAGRIEALVEPDVFQLAQRLKTRDAERLCRLAVVLANVRSDSSAPLARRLGPVLSSLRFQRLMRATGDELTNGLIRALPMVERRCNVAALGADLFYWGDRTRTRWIFDYHGAAVPESLEDTQ